MRRRVPRLQFHLSTLLLVTLAASGLLWLNVQEKAQKTGGNVNLGMCDWTGCCEIGWPWTFLKRDHLFLYREKFDSALLDNLLERFLTPEEQQRLSAWEILLGTEGTASWLWLGMLLDGAICITIPFVLACLQELLERRYRQPGTRAVR